MSQLLAWQLRNKNKKKIDDIYRKKLEAKNCETRGRIFNLKMLKRAEWWFLIVLVSGGNSSNLPNNNSNYSNKPVLIDRDEIIGNGSGKWCWWRRKSDDDHFLFTTMRC